MTEFKEWLDTRCNDKEWLPIKGYPYSPINKVFKIIEENEETLGVILEYTSEGEYIVSYQNNIQTMKLDDFICFIDKGTVTNRHFCIKNGFKFLNYLKTINDLEFKLSDKDFIKYFSQIIYYNSGY